MTHGGTPDVSVIVAVRDAMPYVTRCLESLAGQTIGRDRMEVIAVDDGSTDGGGEVLDDSGFRVVHQAASGGPAAPNNRALSLATGRYVYFIGADDYLGSEALERLVDAADRWSSDVVLGRMAGVGGRYVHQGVFARSAIDIDLWDSDLPWSLSNCKLFRRSLIETCGLRFRESMPVCSDQPFTIEACLRARRISVLADYTYYYAVRRPDAGNLTYRIDPITQLECAEELMDFVAGRIPAGPRRDRVLTRHFAWELGKLLQDRFLELDRPVQEKICAGVARLADRYLTPRIADALRDATRRRVIAARRSGVDAVRRRIVRSGLSLIAAAWAPHEPAEEPGPVLVLTIRSAVGTSPVIALPQGSSRPSPSIAAGEAVPGGFRFRLPVGHLLRRPAARHRIRVTVAAGDGTYDLPVPADEHRSQVRRWRRGRPYRLSLIGDDKGRLVLAVAPIRLRRVLRAVAGRIGGRGYAGRNVPPSSS